MKKIAPQADLVIVVGSANSSNSVRLVEVALEHGARASYRVDRATEIDEAWLDGVTTVGVTSGASVPEILVQDVLRWLADRGYGDVEEVAHRRGGPAVLAAARAAPRPQGAREGLRPQPFSSPAARSSGRTLDRSSTTSGSGSSVMSSSCSRRAETITRRSSVPTMPL